ncbi:Uncharacterised protein [Mycobacteroides abscessus subsp. bolletii]|nr:Uncharacterised protein [Mycobacteroides abscessus subsp. bolletii]
MLAPGTTPPAGSGAPIESIGDSGRTPGATPSVEFRSGSTPNSEPGIPYSAEAESVLLMALVPAASSTRRGRIQKPRMYV